MTPDDQKIFSVSLDYRASVCFAMEQAGVPIVLAIRVTNESNEPRTDIRVELRLTPDLGQPAVITIELLRPGESFQAGPIDLRLPAGRLRTVLEAEQAALAWAITVGGLEAAKGEAPVQVLAWNEWPRGCTPPGLLAVYCTPNHPVVASVLQRVRDRLAVDTGNPAIDGYQSHSPARVLAQARALYETIQAIGVTYVGAPASFEATGQKIRLSDAVVREQLGTCLDLSVLHASCLEQMGLHPLVVLIAGHAFPGVWLVDERFPEGVVYDAARLRTSLALDQLCFYDSSASVAVPSVPFDEARAVARSNLQRDETFGWALDVRVARSEHYRPLPVRDLPRPEPAAESGPATESVAAEILATASELPEEIELPTPLPPAPAEPVVARFRQWKDRLLDLSLRNKLLSFRADVRLALPLEVPDIARFEDLLAGDAVLDVLPRPPVDARDNRDPSLVAVRIDPGEVRASRLADLARGTVHAPFSEAELVQRAVALDRAGRSDVEEGGANTLFAAIGFLKWFEAQQSDQARFAPLLLVPVQIEYTRTTRRVRLRRVAQDPVANQTLVEKLRREFGIDLVGIATLDADESGVDVPALLRAARSAIQREPRWEVLEEVALGQFSFAKFLLWKDLDENSATLLQCPVVQHIAAGGRTPFQSPVRPLDPRHLDREVPSAALPLVVDADSTQIAAVHAAVAGRSFVLQGPPGTGKSQTITNLVAAALAANKTVLFVAEKMAALDVVHRRLRQAGLGAWCLELHSSKVDKRHVIAQLAEALDRRERTRGVPWTARGAEVDKLRSELTAYVEALHQPHPLGTTFYLASARLLSLASAPRVAFQVPMTLSEAQDRAFKDQIARFSVAGGAVEPIDRHPWRDTAPTGWSASLEGDVEAALTRVCAAGAAVVDTSGRLARALGANEPADAEGLEPLVALARLVGQGPIPDPTADDAAFRDLSTRGRAWTEAVRVARARREDLAQRWNEGIYRREAVALRQHFAQWSGSFFLLACLALYSARQSLVGKAVRKKLPDDRTIAADLQTAAEVAAGEAGLESERAALAVRLADTWRGEDPAQLSAVLDRAESTRAGLRRWAVSGSPVPQRVFRLLDGAAPDAQRAEVDRLGGDAAAVLAEWTASVSTLAGLVGSGFEAGARFTALV